MLGGNGDAKIGVEANAVVLLLEGQLGPFALTVKNYRSANMKM